MKSLKLKTLAFIALNSIAVSMPVFSQSSYVPSESNLQARKEFSDSKFGVFIGEFTVCLVRVNGI